LQRGLCRFFVVGLGRRAGHRALRFRLHMHELTPGRAAYCGCKRAVTVRAVWRVTTRYLSLQRDYIRAATSRRVAAKHEPARASSICRAVL
jgi:hypothetical protein